MYYYILRKNFYLIFVDLCTTGRQKTDSRESVTIKHHNINIEKFRVYVYILVRMSVHTWAHVYVCICACACIHVNVCMYVSICGVCVVCVYVLCVCVLCVCVFARVHAWHTHMCVYVAMCLYLQSHYSGDYIQ